MKDCKKTISALRCKNTNGLCGYAEQDAFNEVTKTAAEYQQRIVELKEQMRN